VHVGHVPASLTRLVNQPGHHEAPLLQRSSENPERPFFPCHQLCTLYNFGSAMSALCRTNTSSQRKTVEIFLYIVGFQRFFSTMVPTIVTQIPFGSTSSISFRMPLQALMRISRFFSTELRRRQSPHRDYTYTNGRCEYLDNFAEILFLDFISSGSVGHLARFAISICRQVFIFRMHILESGTGHLHKRVHI